MAVAVVDLLEVVHIEHHQHPAAAAHLCGAVQVAVLVQQPGEGIQLVPHLTAINKVQHRQQGNAQPCNVEARQSHLNDGLDGQKEHQGVDQHPAAVLKLPRRDDGGRRKVHDGRKVHQDVNAKVRPAGIDVVFADGEHQPGGDGQGKEQQVAPLATHGRPEPEVHHFLPVHDVHQAEGHRRGEAEPQIVGQDVQPAVARRCAIHRQRHNLQHRDPRNQRKGQKKSPFLLFVQGFAELCEDAHEAQHKKVNGRQDIKITVHCKTFHLWISVIKARICYFSISRCSVFLNQTPRSFTFSRPKAPEHFIGGFASVAPAGTGHRPPPHDSDCPNLDPSHGR